MKTTIIATLLATLAVSAGAFARETPRTELTRAHVNAELLAARASGAVAAPGDAYPGEVALTAPQSRARVKAEARAGAPLAGTAQVEGYPGTPAAPSTRTRADVKAELIEARKLPKQQYDDQSAS